MIESHDKALDKLKQLAVGCRAYAKAHGDMLPPSTRDLKPYLPTSVTSDHSFDLGEYDLFASGKLTDIQDPAEVRLIQHTRPSSPNSKCLVAFVDGHVEALPGGWTHRENKCGTDVRYLVAACVEYADKHDDSLPQSLDDLTPDLGPLLAKGHSFSVNDYELVTSGRFSSIKDRCKSAVLRRKHLLPGGIRIVGFADIHAEIVHETWTFRK